MQVYSLSQKKIIEVPDEGATPPAPAVQSAAIAPPESTGSKVGNFIFNLGKALVKPFVETYKNINAATTIPQAIQAAIVSKINPQLGARIASQNISGQKRAEEIGQDPEKAIRQQLGSSAQIASWAIPYGKAGFVGSKFIVPGAVQGGLAGGGRTMAQEETTLPEIVGNTAISAGIGAGTGAVLQGLGWIYSKVAGKLSGAGKGVQEGIINAKPKATDINYIKNQEEMNVVADKYLGAGSAKEKLTRLPEAMKNIDKTIKVSLSAADDVPVNSTEISSKFLDDFGKNSSFTATDSKFLGAADQVQGRLTSLGNNPTPTAIYNFKSELSGELGPAFKKIAAGNPITPIEEAKISMWGALKDALDNVSPEIRVLNNDQHILGSLTTGLVKSMEKAGVRIPIPGMLAKVPLPVSREAVQTVQSGAGKFLSGAGGAMQSIPAALPEIAMRGIPKATTAITTGGIGVPPTTPEITGGLPPVIPPVTQPTPSYITGHSPEEIYQAMQKAQAAGDNKAEAELRQMYNDENAYQETNPSASGQILNTNARDAENLLDTVESQLINQDGTINKNLIYESKIGPLGHKYEADLNSLMIKFIQSQTTSGRLPSKEQMKMFKEAYAPSVLDSSEAIKAKMVNLRDAIENAKYTKPTAETLPEITQ